MRQSLSKAKRVVIKIGSSVLLNRKGQFGGSFFKRIAHEIQHLEKKKVQSILVSSGAIAAGLDILTLDKAPISIAKKQAIAAIGQMGLMKEYEKAFAKEKMKVAQILLDRDDFEARDRFLNSRHAIAELLKFKVTPIINENDTVSFEEIKFGDNDNLASLVTNLVEADLLILLTDMDGLYTSDPRINSDAQRISLLNEINSQALSFASGTLRLGSTGGMKTKLEAALKACQFGIPTVIASGFQKNIVSRVLSGEDLGTLIVPNQTHQVWSSKKHWLVHMRKTLGAVTVDRGAEKVLKNSGKSLLASGVIAVSGKFELGAAIDVCDENGKIFAKGLASYGAEEIKKIMGCKSSDIGKILGYKLGDEIIHRDDLALL